MNVLPSVQPGPQPASPQQGVAQVLPVRSVDNPVGRQVHQRAPQGTPEQQDEAAERLDRTAEPDGHLSLTAKRALSAYTAHSQDEERRYMRQVLGFELRI